MSPLSRPRRMTADVPGVEEGHEIEKTFELARTWLTEHGRSAAFFLLVQTYETHLPYLRQTFTEGMDRGGLPDQYNIVTAAFRKQARLTVSPAGLEYVRALYDGGVAEADRHVGELLTTLEELGLSPETVVIVTSDHGEELGDRDPDNPGLHGHSVYDEVASVHLIIYDPTRSYPAGRIGVQVRTIDTVHTVLDLLGVPGPEDTDGRSLLPIMRGEETADRPAFIRLYQHPRLSRRDMYSLREGGQKLIVVPADQRHPRRPSIVLFDLEADPGERVDVGGREPERRVAMLSRLTQIRQELKAAGPPNFRPVP